MEKKLSPFSCSRCKEMHFTWPQVPKFLEMPPMPLVPLPKRLMWVRGLLHFFLNLLINIYREPWVWVLSTEYTIVMAKKAVGFLLLHMDSNVFMHSMVSSFCHRSEIESLQQLLLMLKFRSTQWKHRRHHKFINVTLDVWKDLLQLQTLHTCCGVHLKMEL